MSLHRSTLSSLVSSRRLLACCVAGLAAVALVVPAIADNANRAVKAKISPNQIIAIKKAPQAYRPYKLADLKDPKTGKPPAPGTVITLRNGRKVTIERHIAAVNALEKKLNTHGYSLRDKQRKVTVGRLANDKAKLAAQARPIAGVKPDAKMLAILNSPDVLTRQFTQAKLTGIKLPPVTAGTQLQPITIRKSYAPGFGDPSIFGASFKGNLTMKGGVDGVSFSTDAKATVSVLGQSADVLVATADFNAPRTGNLTGKVKVEGLGVNLHNFDKTQATTWRHTGTFSKALPDKLKVEKSFSILGIPMSAELGLKGSVKVQYFANVSPASATAWMIPEVNASAYAQLSVLDIEILDSGLEVGVEGRLTLLNDKFTVAGGVDVGSDSKGTFVKEWHTSRNDVNALSGDLRAYISVQVFGEEVYRPDHVFFDFNGIRRVDNPFSGGDTHYLKASRPVAAR